MAVIGADGKEIDKIASAGGKLGVLLPELDSIDGIKIHEGSKLLEVKINSDRHLLKTGIHDTPDPILPKNLKMFKLKDGRNKSGFRNVFNHKIIEPRITVVKPTVGSAGNYQSSSTAIIRHDIETRVVPLDVLRIRMMTDPYNFTIRQQMSDSVFQDPTIAPGVQKRNKAFYSNGFYLDFELKSMISPMTGQPYTPDETQMILNQQRQQYLAYLLMLDTWRKLPQIDVMDKMKRSHVSIISQGRALNLIVPKPADLMQGELPISCRNITWENTGQVYVDTIYWQIVGVRLFFINKDMASPDEMVYITGKNYGLRWLQDFFGASEIEPFLQLSRINRLVLNYHLAKASENAYMSKIIIQADVQGDPTTKQTQLNNLISSLTSQGTDLMGVEYRATVTPIPVTADSGMMKMIIDTLDDRLISGVGSTRAQMGRTENLNRDTATIMEVENIRNVRTPDEELVGNAFATQMFDPLLAHLLQQDIEQVPVRVVIKRIEPTDEAIDPNLEQKLAELKGTSAGQGGLVQDDAGGQGMEGTKSFGSSGSVIAQREDYLMKVMVDSKTKTVNRSQVVKTLLKEFGYKMKKTIGATGADYVPQDDDETEPEKEATIDDVKAWASIPNTTMMFHYINPNRWTDRDDYEFIAENAKNWDSLSKDQQLVVIRSYYFRNPANNVASILNDYGFKYPSSPEGFCWDVLMPTHKQHLIDPEQRLSWSADFVKMNYEDLNPQEKKVADLLYKWRHTPHTKDGLKNVEPIPEFPQDFKSLAK